MDTTIENNVPNSNNSETSTALEKEKSELQEGAVIEEKMLLENSDYDSADSYSDAEQNVKIRSRSSDLDEQSHSDTGSITLERQEGDGQESIPTKKVDDDEDKKNPQYIPKKGTFYEHDDRTVDDEENENEAEKEKDNKKKVWQDKKEKWTHDKFNDTEQAPKSRAELVAIYGYDIRNEEGPPRARRRRRYGRGPNKYTRTWEDEAAYGKTTPSNIRTKKEKRPKGKNTEDFPPLVQSNENISKDNSVSENQTPTDIKLSNENVSENSPSNEHWKRKDQNYNRKSMERGETAKESTRDNGVVSNQQFIDNRNYQNTTSPKGIRDTLNNKNASQRTNSGRVVKPRRDFKDSDHLGFTTKTRQLRPVKNEKQQILPPRNKQPKEEAPVKSEGFENKGNTSIQEIENEMNKLSVNGVYKGSKHNNQQNNQQRQASVPPRLQNEQKGSKRYSSMRQRSLPEANTPPAVPAYQHSGYYPNEYNQQSEQAGAHQPLIHQAAPIHHTPNQVPQIPPQTIPIPQQVPPVTAAPLLQAQFPQAFAQAPPPAAFLQPGVAPPAFIPQQPPQIINYVQGQPAFTPNYQGFQQQFNPVTPQTELYQPQGGITYYSTDQQVVQRPAPQKRPKAAIPIVAPPSDDKKIAPADQQKTEVKSEANESTEVQQ